MIKPDLLMLDIEMLEVNGINLYQEIRNDAQLMTRAVDFMQLTANQMNITLLVEPLFVILDIDGDLVLQVLNNL